MTTPKQLLETLNQAGFSDAEIARQTGITQPTIQRIRTGQHEDPKTSSASAIQKFYESVMNNPTAA